VGNWWCTKCQSYQESWAEHQDYKSEYTLFRTDKCWSCDEIRLIYTESQKTRYKELVKERTSIPGIVHEVERFSTWWSNNIATVVAYYDDYYRVFLLVYDPTYHSEKPAVFPESYDCNYWGEKIRGKHVSLSDASSEAWIIRNELDYVEKKNYHNPILLIHPASDCSRSFDTFVKEPYVVKKDLPSWTNEPNRYLKPLDIIKVKKKIPNTDNDYFYHAGVYIGNNLVCHTTKKHSVARRIDNWNNFTEGNEGEIIRYCPIVPFKHYSKIAKEIAWSEDSNYLKGSYELAHRNCEHFANMLVYGINYSEQIEEKKGLLFLFKDGGSLIFAFPVAPLINEFGTNNNKGSTINLRDEINEVDNKLGRRTNDRSQSIEAKIEVPPKENCRIM
jgi:hypothetical protein